MIYTYHTAQGKAMLNKGDEFKLIKIGAYKTEAEALAACKAHHAKACKAATNFGRSLPVAYFM